MNIIGVEKSGFGLGFNACLPVCLARCCLPRNGKQANWTLPYIKFASAGMGVCQFALPVCFSSVCLFASSL